MWTQNVPSANFAFYVNLSSGAVSRGLGRDYNNNPAALCVGFYKLLRKAWTQNVPSAAYAYFVTLSSGAVNNYVYADRIGNNAALCVGF